MSIYLMLHSLYSINRLLLTACAFCNPITFILFCLWSFMLLYSSRYGTPALEAEKEIIAYRTEHLADDWKRVDVMLGGDGHVPSNLWGNDSSQKDWPVKNNTVSEQGHQNLCRALCHEIQIYKQILVRAINLDDADVNASLQELNCPDDLTPEVRFCPQNYINYHV